MEHTGGENSSMECLWQMQFPQREGLSCPRNIPLEETLVGRLALSMVIPAAEQVITQAGNDELLILSFDVTTIIISKSIYCDHYWRNIAWQS
jgi:hypothetical protein